MDQQLKQRLVGAAVIFSLAVIFLPMLLDGSGSRNKTLKNDMPPAPDIGSYELVEEKVIELKRKAEKLPPLEPLIVDEVSDPPDIQIAPASVEAETVVKAVVEKVVEVKLKPLVSKPPAAAETVVEPVVELKVPEVIASKQTGGESWVIQLGSFSDKDKAYSLRDRMKKSSFGPVFTEKFRHNGILSYRVRIGPFISRDSASVIKNKVAAKYNIKGIVMPFEQ
ncbi:MAG: SPOR domain-containing protein [Gammaproteobacteria bacterium]|nr:SPOR domain-containing protein [Gammaproteobacteria bacterium]MBL6998237.1 SPOR domain-containing protein [Gammaproteobacteria bacterium]